MEAHEVLGEVHPQVGVGIGGPGQSVSFVSGKHIHEEPIHSVDMCAYTPHPTDSLLGAYFPGET